jgi:hypothetical protein
VHWELNYATPLDVCVAVAALQNLYMRKYVVGNWLVQNQVHGKNFFLSSVEALMSLFML